MEPQVSQDAYARIAGVLFILYIAAGIGGTAMVRAHAADADLVFRSGVLLQLLGSFCAIGLGWSLYQLLNASRAALLALMCRLAEGVTGAVGAAALLARPPDASSAGFAALLSRATFPVGVSFFSVGSLIFFGLLARARLVPGWLGTVGIAGSIASLALGTMLMLADKWPPTIQLLWLPMLIAEVGTAILFLWRGAGSRA